MPSNFYITTPIYYVNDVPHIGHAYTTIACDTIARFKRLQNHEVMFLTGTDEHGQKVEKSAFDASMDPKKFTDKVSKRFLELTKTLETSNDDFIRTTEKRHIDTVKTIWNKLIDKGDCYLGNYKGWYSIRDEAFYSEKEISIDKNGKKFAPSGAEVSWVEEPSYFFKLSAWQDKLLEHYEKNPNFIAPKSRRNEVISFVKGGLQDLSVSRTSFNWGIKVPNDEKHIVYVWLDALTNYISATGYLNSSENKFKKFWPADIHIVGKDILRFHAVYWPAFLLAANIPLPKRIFAHGWWTIEGEKMSKSLGNVVDPFDMVQKYGIDRVRYYLLREIPFGQDGDFSNESFIKRVNSELSNDYGNLVHRVLSIIYKNYNGIIPSPTQYIHEEDSHLIEFSNQAYKNVCNYMEIQEINNAITEVWKVIRVANIYIDKQAPWSKDIARERKDTILYNLSECIRRVALLSLAFTPNASEKVLDFLGQSKDFRLFSKFNSKLTPGIKITAPKSLFPKIEKEIM